MADADTLLVPPSSRSTFDASGAARTAATLATATAIDAAAAENIRRVGHLTRLFADAGVIALASLVSPLKSDREIAQALSEAAKLPFIEVFVATPREECERRDPKGLYARARAGQLKGLTGVDAPHQAPENPDLTLDTTGADIDALVAQVIGLVKWL